MSTTSTIVELQKLKEGELQKEIASQRSLVAQLRMAVRHGKEKGSHKLKAAKRQLAVMLTVLSILHKKDKVATLPASAAGAASSS